ncbi:hypothetical protein B0H63DRAFT_68951 [Podospora didyma]|uniref:Nephrocystin 3-like N-terminal domain-containing protein n=1 Tax=Podospora didyma TaxID=330526 RepID=A0AAE0K136_9PEZI|nr:hypothetical protein B0H63DRAFT_68951 [Podospora didyma]
MRSDLESREENTRSYPHLAIALNFKQKQRETLIKWHKGTGKWLLDSPSFQKGVVGEPNSTLRCPGNAGAGKTVMVSAIIRHLDENTQKPQDAIAFVYCGSEVPETTSEVGILSSISRQLAQQCRHLPVELRALYERQQELSAFRSEAELVSLVENLAKNFEKTCPSPLTMMLIVTEFLITD